MTHRRTRGLAAGLAAAAVLSGTALATPATAASSTHQASASAPAAKALGTRSLAFVLKQDGTGFDHDSRDFDVLDAAVRRVLAAKPNSPVSLLTKGRTALTLFAPTDAAFSRLVVTLTGKKPTSEADAVKRLNRAVDVDTLEAVLLYHVIPGKTLASPQVLKAAKAGDALKTAQGGTVTVSLQNGSVVLYDKDPDVPNPRAIGSQLDINKGNRQIAHAINRVLLPVNL